jgi:hypothetical protein
MSKRNTSLIIRTYLLFESDSREAVVYYMHSSILRRIWLNFMAQYLSFSVLIQFSFFFSDFQLFRPEYHWRDLSSRNAHLVHQDWYRISLTWKNNFSRIWNVGTLNAFLFISLCVSCWDTILVFFSVLFVFGCYSQSRTGWQNVYIRVYVFNDSWFSLYTFFGYHINFFP